METSPGLKYMVGWPYVNSLAHGGELVTPRENNGISPHYWNWKELSVLALDHHLPDSGDKIIRKSCVWIYIENRVNILTISIIASLTFAMNPLLFQLCAYYALVARKFSHKQQNMWAAASQVLGSHAWFRYRDFVLSYISKWPFYERVPN